jgi:hypothetical protein
VSRLSCDWLTMGNGMLRACKQPLVGRNDTKSGCVGDYIPVYSYHFSLHFDSISCAKTWTMDVHRPVHRPIHRPVHRPGFSTCRSTEHTEHGAHEVRSNRKTKILYNKIMCLLLQIFVIINKDFSRIYTLGK